MEMLYIAFASLSFTLLAWYRLEYAIYACILLLPTYLIRFSIGPIPTTFLEIMIGILVLITLIQYKKYSENSLLPKLFKNHPTLIIATSIFLLSATIGIFIADDTRTALGEWKAFYIEPIFFVGVILTVCTQKKHVPTLLASLAISGIATGLLAIYQHFTGWLVPYAFWENRNTYRVTAWYGFPNAVGLFLGPLFCVGIYFLHDSAKLYLKNSQKKYIAYGFFGALSMTTSLLGTIYAKSTGALMGMIASIGTLLFIYKKTRIPMLILTSIAILTIIFMPNNAIKQELLFQDFSGQLRINMWGETIEFLRDYPIFGAGLGNYNEKIYPYRIDKWIEVFHHPHNIFLTMWVNIGFIGMLSFTWILVWFFRVGLHAVWKKQYALRTTPYIIGMMSAFVIMGLVDSPYIKNDLALYFWIIIALMLIQTTQKNIDNSIAKKS